MLNKETTGVVMEAKKQWWLKVNTKPIRMHAMDGATFPYIIRVKYTVEGKEYMRRKWIHAGHPVPAVGNTVRVAYCADKPQRSKVL